MKQKALLAGLGAIAVFTACSMEEVAARLPTPEPEPSVVEEGDRVRIEGRFEGGLHEINEHRFVAPAGERFRYVVNTAFPGGSGRALFDLFEVDPVDPDNPDKWRNANAGQGTKRVDLGAAEPFAAGPYLRSDRGEYVLKAGSIRGEGRYSILVERFAPTPVEGLTFTGQLGDTLNLIPEYLVHIPESGTNRFQFEVNTAFPGGSGVLLVDLLEVDPVDPDDPERWTIARPGGNFTRVQMGAPEPTISSIYPRSQSGTYVVRLRNVGAEGRYEFTFRPM